MNNKLGGQLGNRNEDSTFSTSSATNFPKTCPPGPAVYVPCRRRRLPCSRVRIRAYLGTFRDMEIAWFIEFQGQVSTLVYDRATYNSKYMCTYPIYPASIHCDFRTGFEFLKPNIPSGLGTVTMRLAR